MVTASTPWQGGLVAISSFGFGGSNAHCLVAGAVRAMGPPPRPPTPLLRADAGPEPVEEGTESSAPRFPSEVRSRVHALGQRKDRWAGLRGALRRC